MVNEQDNCLRFPKTIAAIQDRTRILPTLGMEQIHLAVESHPT
jgi:hypothetical protein